MKFYNIILATAAMFCLVACEKDNYDAPDTLFQGRIVYNGQPVHVEWNQVRFQLWEPAYESLIPIDVSIDQDGSFSALLFSGMYKLSFPENQGPYLPVENETTNSDTIILNLSGNTTMDIEVLPYYMINNSSFEAGNRTVSASVQIDQIITDEDAKNIERVFLYVNRSNFVSGATNVARSEIAGADITDMNNISLAVDVPELLPSQNYIYARVGVKIEGVEDMLFSEIQKVDL